MKVQAQVSIYPLRTEALAKPVEEFCRRLQDRGLKVNIRSMSTSIVGDSDRVFQAVKRAFQGLAADYEVVMDLKVSNACPETPESGYGKEVD